MHLLSLSTLLCISLIGIGSTAARPAFHFVQTMDHGFPRQIFLIQRRPIYQVSCGPFGLF